MSGDSEGKLWFWDWKTCKVFKYGGRARQRAACARAGRSPCPPRARAGAGTVRGCRTIKAHDKVVIDCQWHPHESSKVATASWDGTIKYWD